MEQLALSIPKHFRAKGRPRLTRKQIINNLASKYGREFLSDYQILFTKPFWTLTSIAEKYGFTRERARQIYNIIYQKGYNSVKTKKTRKVNSEVKLVCVHDPRRKVAEYKGGPVRTGALSELAALLICTDLGYEVLPHCSPEYDLNINGWKVDVKSASIPQKSLNSLSGYYHLRATDRQVEICDFFICHIQPQDRWFIVPNPKRSYFYIRDTEVPLGQRGFNKKTKSVLDSQKYENAWQLLNPQP